MRFFPFVFKLIAQVPISFQVCHGRYVMQYHEEKETKKRTEYFLGNYVGVSAAVVSPFLIKIH